LTVTLLPEPFTILYEDIANARRRQLAARMAWARSANTDTIAAEQAATREVDVLLDRVLLYRSTRVHTDAGREPRLHGPHRPQSEEAPHNAPRRHREEAEASLPTPPALSREDNDDRNHDC
jgi:hypothetical protein